MKPHYVPGETIVLRGGDGRIGYVDTADIRGMRRRNATLNEALAATTVDLDELAPIGRIGRHLIQINEQLVLSTGATGLYRVFNYQFSLGGRFYGGFWQSLSKDLRRHLTIGGQPTVELDFSGCHPRIIAAEIGIELDGDLYDVPEWDRDVVKRALLVLLNAPTFKKAVSRIAYDLGDTPWESASRLVKAIKARHPGLSCAFHTGAGLRLMRRDSDIADAVFSRLLRRGIVPLGVHDSNVVAARYEGELREAMHAVWREQLSTNPIIKTVA